MNANEIRSCIFYWTFASNMCKYKLPNLKPGNPPSVSKNCEILNSSYKIIPPSPPRTKPSPIPCAYAGFPNYDLKTINDPNECYKCSGFKGYPDSWPPRGRGNEIYGPSNTKWIANGQEKESFEQFTYIVQWTRFIRCKNRSGQWRAPSIQRTSITQKAKWIIQNGISTTSGYTAVRCAKRPRPVR